MILVIVLALLVAVSYHAPLALVPSLLLLIQLDSAPVQQGNTGIRTFAQLVAICALHALVQQQIVLHVH